MAQVTHVCKAFLMEAPLLLALLPVANPESSLGAKKVHHRLATFLQAGVWVISPWESLRLLVPRTIH